MFDWARALPSANDQPNPGQAVLRLLGPQDVLIVAPAGCGKTEALAERAQALVAGGAVPRPRKLLALTFSNRARDNLRARVRSKMGHQYWRRVSVTNLHGFAARVIRAHGGAAGIDPELIYPDQGWRRRTLRDLGVAWRELESVNESLRTAKQGPYNDEEVLERLESGSSSHAIAFQKTLVAENRMDFDDVLRHAQCILKVPEVANLYRNHFAAVLLDEVQDLTPQQLEIVLAIGGSAVTAAADPAQGIYSFAGANLEHALSTLRGRGPAEVEFNLCYRFAPRVLTAVNALAALQGATELMCANPEAWSDEGRVAILRRRTLEEEAGALLDAVEGLLTQDTKSSIGLVVRRRSRREAAEREASSRGIDYQIWDVATHNRTVVRLLRRNLPSALAVPTAAEQLAALETECRAAVNPEEIETHYELVSACESLRDLIEQGFGLEQALATCRESSADEDAVGPGIHFINGHVAKGQQFDWVVVIGMEDGHIPDYRSTSDADQLAEELRVLHVMVSRARVGVALTFTEGHFNQYGRWFDNSESRWLAPLEELATEAW